MLKNKIFENLSDLIVIVNTDAVIVDLSASVVSLFKYSREELLGENFQKLLPERYRQGHRAMFEGYMQNPVSRRMGTGKILYGLDKNGNELPIDIALSSFSENGENYFVAVIRDVSSLLEYQAKLERLNKQLVAKNKELDQFAHIVAHDLKSPVNNLFGLIDLIKMEHGKELSSELSTYCNYIEQTSTKLSELIEGILNYSSAGAGNVENTDFILRDLLNEVLNNISIPESFKITIECPDIKIKSTQIQLFQILTNIMSNAIKYHDKETGNIMILCSFYSKGIEITVKDDGPGIPQKYQSKIFDLFGKGHKDKRRDSTGIGLATVKKLVEQNGGEIELKSKPGAGTEFKFTWLCEIQHF